MTVSKLTSGYKVSNKITADGDFIKGEQRDDSFLFLFFLFFKYLVREGLTFRVLSCEGHLTHLSAFSDGFTVRYVFCLALTERLFSDTLKCRAAESFSPDQHAACQSKSEKLQIDLICSRGSVKCCDPRV